MLDSLLVLAFIGCVSTMLILIDWCDQHIKED